jgi:hypothetical protein
MEVMNKNAPSMIVGLTVGLFCLVSGALLGWAWREDEANKEQLALLQSLEYNTEELSIARVKTTTLSKVIKEAQTENLILHEIIAALENQAPKIKYIVKTETQLVAAEPEIIYTTIPTKHQHVLDNGLVVADFLSNGKTYAFTTYDLQFRTTLVLADNKSVAKLEASSSFDETWYPTETTLEVSRVDDQQFFEPHIMVGLTTSVPPFNLQASLVSTLLHRNQWDFVGIRLSGSQESFAIGLDPIYYNLGHDLPVLTDAWIGLGVSTDLYGQPSGSLTIGTKF